MGQYHLESMFNPRHIAVVGASEKKGTIGHALMKNLMDGGFAGIILPVNPKYKTIHGYDCVKSVCDLMPEVDLTIIATPIHTAILPRDTILSVQLTCSRKNRIEKLANMMGIDKGEAETKLKAFDDGHHEFFKAVYLKEKISSDEFDLIINMDQIKSGYQVAQIIACSFEQKFQVNFKNK